MGLEQCSGFDKNINIGMLVWSEKFLKVQLICQKNISYDMKCSWKFPLVRICPPKGSLSFLWKYSFMGKLLANNSEVTSSQTLKPLLWKLLRYGITGGFPGPFKRERPRGACQNWASIPAHGVWWETGLHVCPLHSSHTLAQLCLTRELLRAAGQGGGGSFPLC